MKSKEEKLQDMVFGQKLSDEDEDLNSEEINVYEKIGRFLSNEPEIQIPVNFSDTVVNRLQKRISFIQRIKTSMMVVGMILALVISVYGSYSYTKNPFFEVFISTIQSNLGYLAIGLGAFILIQVFDYLLLKNDYKRMMRI